MKFLVLQAFRYGHRLCGTSADLSSGTERRTTHNLPQTDRWRLSRDSAARSDRSPAAFGEFSGVLWIQGDRFGVELLIMDADERIRLDQFLETTLPLELEVQSTRSELIISAAE